MNIEKQANWKRRNPNKFYVLMMKILQYVLWDAKILNNVLDQHNIARVFIRQEQESMSMAKVLQNTLKNKWGTWKFAVEILNKKKEDDIKEKKKANKNLKKNWKRSLNY